MLADDVAGAVEALDADVVEVAGTVDGRARVRLRDHEQAPAARLFPELCRQLHEARRQRLALALAQQPEARSPDDRQARAAVLLDEIVATVPDEREVVVHEPLQECPGLVDLVPRQREVAAAELGVDREHALAHRLPVGDGRAHVVQDAHDAGGERRAVLRVGKTVDLDVHQRLALRRDLGPLALDIGQ